MGLKNWLAERALRLTIGGETMSGIRAFLSGKKMYLTGTIAVLGGVLLIVNAAQSDPVAIDGIKEGIAAIVAGIGLMSAKAAILKGTIPPA